MTVKIMAADRTEARSVARALRLMEWQFVDNENGFRGSSHAVVVLAPQANKHEDFAKLINLARLRDSQIFEVDAYRRKFMQVALLVRQTGDADHEEREEWVRDDADAKRLDGVDGWQLVWWGFEGEE